MSDPDRHTTLILRAARAAPGGTVALEQERAGETTESLVLVPHPEISTSSRYVILREHAVGGLGRIAVAVDRELNRQVAYKQIRLKFREDVATRLRFWREGVITAQLEHPNIVPVYGIGVGADGLPFYTMRFVEGVTLAEAIRRHHDLADTDQKKASLVDLLGRLVQVCNAVAYAHSRGVIHCDLKPDNILLGPFGETLIVDWGLARITSEEFRDEVDAAMPERLPDSAALEGRLDILGTPVYMSPEQRAGVPNGIGPLTDVYSLGVTLAEILTGSPPQACDDAFSDALYPERVSARVREAVSRQPAGLAAICVKATCPNPYDRHLSVLGLALDVTRYLGDENLVSAREPRRARAGRWLRRNREKIRVSGLTAACLGVMYIIAELCGWIE